MSVIWGILAIVFSLFSLSMFFGLINPNWFNKNLKPNQKPLTRKIALILWFVFGFLGMAFAGIGSSPDSNADKKEVAPVSTSANNQADVKEAKSVAIDDKAVEEAKKKADEEAQKKADEEKKKQEIPGTIGMTPEEFKAAFNKFSNDFGSSLKIKTLKVQDGPVQDGFKVILTDNLGITGTVNKKDGSVRDVLILGRGDGTPKSGSDLIVSFGILIAATNPDLSSDERGGVLKDLGFFEKNVDVNKMDKSTIRNGIEYSIKGSDMLGLMFSAKDANDHR